MTTEVKISMATPHNNKDIMVDVVDGPYNEGTDSEESAEVSESHRCRDGEEVTVYVHDTRSLKVREVDKEVAEENQAEANDGSGED